MAISAYPSGDNAVTATQYARDLATWWGGDGIQAAAGSDACLAYTSGAEWRVDPGYVLLAGAIVFHVGAIEAGSFPGSGPLKYYLVARIDFSDSSLLPEIVAKAGSSSAYPSVGASYTGVYEFVLGGFTKSAGGAVTRDFAARTYLKPPDVTVEDHTTLSKPVTGQEVFEYGSGERWLRQADGWENLTTGNGAWTSYTPTFTATVTNPSVGGTGGFRSGAYMRIGRLIVGRFKINFGTGFSPGVGEYLIGLPPGCDGADPGDLPQNMVMGTTQVYREAGYSTLAASILLNSDHTKIIHRTAAGKAIGPGSPYVWKVGSSFMGAFTYEAATD